MPGVKRSADSQAASRAHDEPAAKRVKVAQSKSAGEVPRLVAQREQVRSAFGPVAQLEGGLEDELPAQGKGIAQLAGVEEELPVQGKGIAQMVSPEEEFPAQGKGIAQRVSAEEELPAQGKGIAQLAGVEEELPMQGKGIAQLASEEEEPMQGKGISQLAGVEEELPIQGKGTGQENRTGMPDDLKAGVEGLSGMSMNDVKVHYNSAQPSQLNALAYAQGNDIHVAPGQEQHLPHEAWHVVQQAQGRVKPTMQMQGRSVNDDASLESEADVMGARALQAKAEPGALAAGATVQLAREVLQAKKDKYIPDAGEPHIHVHDGGITFTDVGHGHKYLVRGDRTLANNVAAVVQDLNAAGDARSLQIVQWINANI